jgi:periplasmic protein TonB
MKNIYFIIILLLCVTVKVGAQQRLEITDSIDSPFTTVEVEAEFPGGASAWRIFLQQNLNADIPNKRKAPAGTYQVVIKFIVDKNGKISSISAETNFGYGMEKEVIRVIKKSPKWTPAIQNGNIVKAWRRQPVTFMITEE